MAKLPLSDIAQAFEQAVDLVRQRRLDDAERICTRILKQLPTSFDALHLLGIIKLQAGKPAVDLSPMSCMRFKDKSWSEAQLQREAAWQYRHFYGAV